MKLKISIFISHSYIYEYVYCFSSPVRNEISFVFLSRRLLDMLMSKTIEHEIYYGLRMMCVVSVIFALMYHSVWPSLLLGRRMKT